MHVYGHRSGELGVLGTAKQWAASYVGDFDDGRAAESRFPMYNEVTNWAVQNADTIESDSWAYAWAREEDWVGGLLEDCISCGEDYKHFAGTGDRECTCVVREETVMWEDEFNKHKWLPSFDDYNSSLHELPQNKWMAVHDENRAGQPEWVYRYHDELHTFTDWRKKLLQHLPNPVVNFDPENEMFEGILKHIMIMGKSN